MVCDDVTRTRWQRSHLYISTLQHYMMLAAVLAVSTEGHYIKNNWFSV